MTDSGGPAKRFVVIGSGKTAIDVARILHANDLARLVALIGDPRRETPQSTLRLVAERLSVPYHATHSLSASETLDVLRAAAPDYVISANNFLIFRRAALAIPKIATVNFHNGPLPQYAGLNPGSWALINGEQRYGISWHLVEERIDAGGVLVSRSFELEARETAVSLIVRCIREGISSFKAELLPRLSRADLGVLPQDLGERHYYSGKDVPFDGLLPWWLPAGRLYGLVRALTFAPLPNMFYRPRLVLPGGTTAYCERVEYEMESVTEPPGRIIANDGSRIRVAATQGVLVVEGFFTAEDEPMDLARVDLARALAVGQVLQRH
jgi:methionyl-tRNA formyltransferase